jgi:hypothetical protein
MCNPTELKNNTTECPQSEEHIKNKEVVLNYILYKRTHSQTVMSQNDDKITASVK